LSELTQRGQSSLVRLRLLLTQHSFALTAGDALRCGSCLQPGHLQTWFRAEPIMYFRCGRDRHERRGTKRAFVLVATMTAFGFLE
jgi:hypothetical protein